MPSPTRRTLLTNKNDNDMQNALLTPHYTTPHGTIPFPIIQTADYEPALREAMRQEDEEIAAIINNPDAPTFDNTVVALAEAGQLLNRVTTVLFNLLSAETNDELEAVAEKMMPELSEHSNNITLNVQLFERIRTVYGQRDSLPLTPEERQLLENTYDGFRRNGATLSDEDKAVFRRLTAELSSLTLRFSQNHLKETNKYELHLTDEEQLKGLPDSAREAAALAAQERDKEGWVFTLHAPSYQPFLKYSACRELRKELYMAYNTQCCHGDELDNCDIVKQIGRAHV